MKLLADLHTHSKNSRFGHGKNKIEEMAIEANEIGLVEIGITDHGFAHLFKTSKSKLKEARKIVDEINSWSKTKVLLGVEADIVSEDGTLDIDNETLAMLDILIVGYHRMIFTDFANFFGKTKNTAEARQKCTNAFVNAINKYPVTIVSHLDSVLKTDLYEIGKACSERGTMVEINNRHTKWNEKQVEDLLASGCMFVVSSDAHSRNKVGEVDKAFEIIKKFNIPSDRVANVEFTDDEKSEFDREYSAYKAVYDQLETTKKKKEEILEKKRKTEITGKLSSEMESELQKIANEKGLKYEGYKSETVNGDFYSKMNDDEINLINRAEEYIKKQQIKEFQDENDSIDEETQYEIEETHPIMSGFERNFQAINNLVKESEDETLSKPSTQVDEPPKDDFASNNLDTTTAAYEQLENASKNAARVQGIKNLINSVSGEEIPANNINSQENNIKPATSSYKKPTPENFMQSITQGNLAGNVNVEQEIKAESETAQKPVRKTGRRGGFIAVDDLLGGDKK